MNPELLYRLLEKADESHVVIRQDFSEKPKNSDIQAINPGNADASRIPQVPEALSAQMEADERLLLEIPPKAFENASTPTIKQRLEACLARLGAERAEYLPDKDASKAPALAKDDGKWHAADSLEDKLFPFKCGNETYLLPIDEISAYKRLNDLCLTLPARATKPSDPPLTARIYVGVEGNHITRIRLDNYNFKKSPIALLGMFPKLKQVEYVDCLFHWDDAETIEHVKALIKKGIDFSCFPKIPEGLVPALREKGMLYPFEYQDKTYHVPPAEADACNLLHKYCKDPSSRAGGKGEYELLMRDNHVKGIKLKNVPYVPMLVVYGFPHLKSLDLSECQIEGMVCSKYSRKMMELLAKQGVSVVPPPGFAPQASSKPDA
jgi:hypothetical protein